MKRCKGVYQASENIDISRIQHLKLLSSPRLQPKEPFAFFHPLAGSLLLQAMSTVEKQSHPRVSQEHQGPPVLLRK